MFHFLRKESGQVLLVVILVMVATLTIGLSIASKTITNYRTTTAQVESQKHFLRLRRELNKQSKLAVMSPLLPVLELIFQRRLLFPQEQSSCLTAET
jgi:hypothetical protein